MKRWRCTVCGSHGGALDVAAALDAHARIASHPAELVMSDWPTEEPLALATPDLLGWSDA